MGFNTERGFCVGPVSSSLTISSASSSSSSVSLSIPSHQSRVTSWAKESPGSWFSEFKRGKLVSFPQSLSLPLNASYILQSKMAKWPKDSPGTWYSHYKRGSLVSGPACSPGSGLDFVCLLRCMALVLPSASMCSIHPHWHRRRSESPCVASVGMSCVRLLSVKQQRRCSENKWRRGDGGPIRHCHPPHIRTSATLRKLLHLTACLDVKPDSSLPAHG